MDEILENISKYLQMRHKVDPYTATDEQLLQAGYWLNDENGFLVKLPRMKSNLKQRFQGSLWKVCKLYSDCEQENLYTLLIELDTDRLYSPETAELAKGIMSQIEGGWFYTTETGVNRGVHMHVLLHSKKPPPKRITFAGRRYQTRPWKLNQNHPENTKLEGIVKTVCYMSKIKTGAYRKRVRQRLESTWLAEVREAYDCDRHTGLKLSKHNLHSRTRGMKTPSSEVMDVFKRVRSKAVR